MLGSQTALRIAPRHEEHPVAHQRPALTMHRRDMHEQLFAALLRTNEAEALVVVPAFQRTPSFHARARECKARMLTEQATLGIRAAGRYGHGMAVGVMVG